MIKTRQRAQEDILAEIPVGAAVGIVGCGECAAALGNGGTKAVDAWTKTFTGRNPVVFAMVAESPCDQRFLGKSLLLLSEFKDAEYLLTLACPAGIQSLVDWLSREHRNQKVIAGLTAIGMGWLKAGPTWVEACRFCKDCTYDPKQGRCPVPECPLQKADGPCQNRGVDDSCPLAETTCIWIKQP